MHSHNVTTRHSTCLLTVMMVVAAPVGRLFADLDDYIHRADDSYAWSNTSTQSQMNVEVTELDLTSQTWMGIPWRHRIVVFRSAQPKHPQTCLLIITGGNPGSDTNLIGAMAANMTGAPVAILFNEPNQPLFGGKKEDALIAHTFVKYMEAGDESWPLLLPMTKAAVKAMDALQAFSRQAWTQPVTGFVVTGASKRGWTTWLTAAADPRVRAIAPIVYDNLDLHAQMAHQLEVWGSYSEEIHDYSDLHLMDALATPVGRRLVEIVDPWRYRDRLTMPKLIIAGTNDAYWPLDALNLYWDGLPAEKQVLYIPNAGHGLNDNYAKPLAAIAALVRQAAGKEKLPKLRWQHADVDGKPTLTVTSAPTPTTVRLWSATSPTRDFRPARWQSAEVAVVDGRAIATVERPQAGFAAFFAEVDYSVAGTAFSLCTQVRILEPATG